MIGCTGASLKVKRCWFQSRLELFCAASDGERRVDNRMLGRVQHQHTGTIHGTFCFRSSPATVSKIIAESSFYTLPHNMVDHATVHSKTYTGAGLAIYSKTTSVVVFTTSLGSGRLLVDSLHHGLDTREQSGNENCFPNETRCTRWIHGCIARLKRVQHSLRKHQFVAWQWREGIMSHLIAYLGSYGCDYFGRFRCNCHVEDRKNSTMGGAVTVVSDA